MDTPTDAQQRAWAAQWRLAGPALARIRQQEIANVDLWRVAADLEDACMASVRARGTTQTSGLIEQQRLLNRRRR